MQVDTEEVNEDYENALETDARLNTGAGEVSA